MARKRSANTELGIDASTGTAADSRTGTHGNTFAGRDEQFADGVPTGGCPIGDGGFRIILHFFFGFYFFDATQRNTAEHNAAELPSGGGKRTGQRCADPAAEDGTPEEFEGRRGCDRKSHSRQGHLFLFDRA